MKKILLFVITTLIFAPSVTLAQQYLVGLPIDTKGSFDQYINLLYKMSISIAALLAVVKIIIAGAKYMLSDVVTTKSAAKNDIKGALLGLLLIVGAVIILNTINPALTDGGLNIKKLEKVSATVNPPPVAVPPAGSTANPTTPAGGASTAANLATTQTTSGCGSADASNSTYTITVVRVSGCSSTQIGTVLIDNLKRSCASAGGVMAYSGSPIVSAACAVPKTSAVAPTTACNPAITTSISGIYTVFSQNLTGCSAADQVTYRATLDAQCKAYGVFATGSSIIRSCSVPTSRI